ncbi:MAG TPA: transcription antitermination factor NusB [Propionibacterium sp.]|nr:transcription antitermination factor NusB [Propionibacterium sp.]
MTERRDNSTRTKARKRALDILYESELRDRPSAETLAERIGLGPVRPFTIELVNGVIEHVDALDAVIEASLTGGWTLDRMARVDRNLARIALFEAVHTDTPAAVAIAEAVGLAGEFSTPESPAFLNGVLSAAVQRAAAPAPAQADQAEADTMPGDPGTE